MIILLCRMSIRQFKRFISSSLTPPCDLTYVVCRTPLHAASVAEDVSGLLLILRMGADINAVDQSGRSALMVAADKGKSGAVGKDGSGAYWVWFFFIYLLQ